MKTTIKSILGAFALTLGFAACGNTDGLTPEELGESESALTLSFCQVKSSTDNMQTGLCYNGKALISNGPCAAGHKAGTPTSATLTNGAVVWIDQTNCNNF